MTPIRWPAIPPDCPNCKHGHMQSLHWRGETVMSHCPECGHTERWDDP